MGIKQLYKLIADYAPDAVETRALSELGDRRVVIDLFLYLHRFNATQGNCFTGLFHQIMLLKEIALPPSISLTVIARSSSALRCISEKKQ